LGRVLPRQHASGQWCICDQGDSELTAGIENTVALGLPVQEGVLDLVGCERDAALGECGMGLTHLFL
jgi:hypothetical protein